MDIKTNKDDHEAYQITKLYQLYCNLQTKLKQEKPQYLKLMKQYLPEYLKSPFERYKAKNSDASEDELRILFNIEKHQSYSDINADYANCIGNLDLSIIGRIKHDLAKNAYEKTLAEKMNIDDVNTLYSFSKLYDCIQRLQCVFDDTIEKYKRIAKNYYIDSVPLVFNNEDIIITDPCYLTLDNDWEKSEYGENFEIFGIQRYASKSTLYGDWSCTIYNADTHKPIGKFCADAGMVTIMGLDDVKKYLNNSIEDWVKNHQWCATVIRSFNGIAQIKTGFDSKEYSFYRYVEGTGSINFIGQQSGL